MARIEDIIVDCVFFIYPSGQAAIDGEEAGGTGFFLGIPFARQADGMHVYAVTVGHIVRGYDSPTLRINTKDGNFDLVEKKRDEWVIHPEGADLAITPIDIKWEHHKIGYFLREHLINKEFIQDKDVGIGDEVCMVGRFKHYEGSKRNTPVARFGNLAAMPTEPLLNTFTQLDEESFLVEARSISGYSGSPVVLLIEQFSRRPTKEALSSQWYLSLLGIDWGHIRTHEKVRDQAGNTIEYPKMQVQFNSVMMGVVPAWKLNELLEQKEFVESRKEKERLFE